MAEQVCQHPTVRLDGVCKECGEQTHYGVAAPAPAPPAQTCDYCRTGDHAHCMQHTDCAPGTPACHCTNPYHQRGGISQDNVAPAPPAGERRKGERRKGLEHFSKLEGDVYYSLTAGPIWCPNQRVADRRAPAATAPAGGAAEKFLEQRGITPVELAAQHFSVKSLAELLDAYAAELERRVRREAFKEAADRLRQRAAKVEGNPMLSTRTSMTRCDAANVLREEAAALEKEAKK